MRKRKTRRRELAETTRVDDFIADLLEREAGLMPPGFEANAEILRQQAKFFRKSANPDTMMVPKDAAEK